MERKWTETAKKNNYFSQSQYSNRPFFQSFLSNYLKYNDIRHIGNYILLIYS